METRILDFEKSCVDQCLTYRDDLRRQIKLSGIDPLYKKRAFQDHPS